MFKRKTECAELPVIPAALTPTLVGYGGAQGRRESHVSQQPGRASVAITLDVHAAVMPGNRRGIVERVASLVVLPWSATWTLNGIPS